MLLSNANSPHEGAENRTSYLLAPKRRTVRFVLDTKQV